MDFIKVITDKQITLVGKLAAEIWTEHFTDMIGTDQVSYMLSKFQSENAITHQIQDKGYVYYLIEESGNSIGYFAIELQTNMLFLSKLYIHKSARCRGIARKVLEFIRGVASKNNLGQIWLTVNKNNTAAIAAYEKIGFINAGPIVADIGGGFVMDDYKMELAV